MTESLGDRMKANYEDRFRFHLIRRMPVIIRLDGHSFHTITRGCEKPFDAGLASDMIDTTLVLCREIQGAKCAYLQSDEISILLTDFDELATQAWFDYNVQKMVSISAGIASAVFSDLRTRIATFDSRAFNIPKEEVANYFVWRQKDWVRNSVQMLARVHFSHKQLLKKGQADMHEMLHEIGVNWNDLPERWKNGTVIYKSGEGWHTDTSIVFTRQRELVECYLGEATP
jgi:tRNA(His) guanylyltransferase